MITSFSSKVKIGLMDVWLASLSASLADGRQRGSFFTGIGPELMPREAAYSLASSSQQSGSGYPTMLIASFLAALDPSSKGACGLDQLTTVGGVKQFFVVVVVDAGQMKIWRNDLPEISS